MLIQIVFAVLAINRDDYSVEAAELRPALAACLTSAAWLDTLKM